MFRSLRLGFAALLLSGPALADMTLSVTSEGYDDFFKHCDIDFSHDAGDAVSGMEVTYFMDAGAKGRMICQSLERGGGCRETDDMEHTCEDMTRIDVLDVVCKDADEATIPCGSVSVQAGQGISVPVTAGDISPDVDDQLRIFATVLGFDDFFETCEMGFSYQPMSRFDHVEINYDVLVQGEPVNCYSSLSRHSGTGRSCSSLKDYTCDQVSEVRIKEVLCEKEDTEQDCGPVDLRAIEQGFFKDAR